MNYTTADIVRLTRKNVPIELVANAIEREISTLENPGICIECGAERDGCEPDARGYECYDCGKQSVFGAGELALYVV